MITTCTVCGKEFDILYPNLWRYKRSGHAGLVWYLCSWRCLRRYDNDTEARKEATKMNKPTRNRLQIAEKICELIEQKEDPLAYLEQLGYGNVGQAYSDIRKMMKKSRPDLFAKLPTDLRSWRAVNVNGAKPKKKPARIETPEVTLGDAMAGMKDAADEFFGLCDSMGIHAETPEQRRPRGPIEYKVTGISTTAGDFQYFRKQGYIDWTPIDGNGPVSMNLEEWKEFFRVWPKVQEILGVEM